MSTRDGSFNWGLPESARLVGPLMILTVACAVSAGLMAALAPMVAALAVVLVLGGSGLYIFLRKMQGSGDSTQGSMVFQLAFAFLLVSLVRIAQRDPTSSDLGFQAIYEFSLQGLAAGLIVLGLLAGRTRLSLSPALIFWIMFGGFAILSAFWAPQPSVAMLKGTQLIAVCAMAAAVASQFRDRYQAVRFLAWLTVFIVVGAILIQGATEGFSNLRTLTGETDGRYRLNLLTIHPIHLGGFCGTSAILLLVHRPRRLDWLAFAFLVAITVLTAARGPIGTLFLVIVCYLILRSRFNIHSYVAWTMGILMPIFILASGLLTLPGGPGGSTSSTFGNLERDITTLNGRIPLWKAILERADSGGSHELATLVGNGYASFRHFFLDDFVYGGDAHNAVIQVFSELGIVGALLWLLAVGACGRLAWNAESSRRRKLIAIVPIFYILGIQMVDASLADSRSFLLVILLFYAHAGWSPQERPAYSPVPSYRSPLPGQGRRNAVPVMRSPGTRAASRH